MVQQWNILSDLNQNRGEYGYPTNTTSGLTSVLNKFLRLAHKRGKLLN